MTLTIESCTPAVQPSQTRTTSRNPVRTSRCATRERASVDWNVKISVSTDRSTASIATCSRASLHASTQVATGGSSSVSGSNCGSNCGCTCGSGCGGGGGGGGGTTR